MEPQDVGCGSYSTAVLCHHWEVVGLATFMLIAVSKEDAVNVVRVVLPRGVQNTFALRWLFYWLRLGIGSMWIVWSPLLFWHGGLLQVGVIQVLEGSV